MDRPGRAAIPRAYLRKWQQTIDTLSRLRPGTEVTLTGVDDQDALAVLLSAGGGRPDRELPDDAPEHVVAESRHTVVQPIQGRTSVGFCGVPLSWPDRRVSECSRPAAPGRTR